MTYSTLEISAEDGRPLEFYRFELTAGTYNLTSSPVDVSFGGVTYTATTISRGPITLSQLGKVRECVVSIPVNHSLATALRLGGVPPRQMLCTITRTHLGTDDSIQLWRGHIASVASDGVLIRITIPNEIDEAFASPVGAMVSVLCNHQLYDSGCGLSRSDPAVIAAHRTMSTVTGSSGTSVTVSATGVPNGYWDLGEIVQVSTGERRSILTSTTGASTTLVIDCPFPALTGSVELWRGCDRTLDECIDTFDNLLNFGGHPHLPSDNPNDPNGLGVGVGEDD